jgi:hypothetical protein
MAEIIEVPQEELESIFAVWLKHAHANNVYIDSIIIEENAFKFLLIWELTRLQVLMAVSIEKDTWHCSLSCRSEIADDWKNDRVC